MNSLWRSDHRQNVNPLESRGEDRKGERNFIERKIVLGRQTNQITSSVTDNLRFEISPESGGGDHWRQFSSVGGQF